MHMLTVLQMHSKLLEIIIETYGNYMKTQPENRTYHL